MQGIRKLIASPLSFPLSPTKKLGKNRVGSG